MGRSPIQPGLIADAKPKWSAAARGSPSVASFGNVSPNTEGLQREALDCRSEVNQTNSKQQ
jgi:hypothetical protein